LTQKYISASATVEGALVIPLFVYATVAIIFMLYVFMIRTQVNNALYNTVRKINRYAYISESVKTISENDKDSVISSLKNTGENADMCRSVISMAEVTAVFIEEIGMSYAEDNYITGGNAGWVFAGSQILENGSQINITLTYLVKNPFNIWGKQGIYIREHCITDAWLGEDKCSYEPSDYADGDTYVYITENGTVFHTNIDCTYLSHQIKSASISDILQLRNEAGAKYYKCSRCEGESSTVYYTPYGRSYHTSAACDALSHNITKIKREIAERTMRCCIKCAGEEMD